MKNNNVTLINKKGTIIGPVKWATEIGKFENGFSTISIPDETIKNENIWNWIDGDGKLLCPNKWHKWAGTFCKKYAKVRRSDGKHNCVDNHGNIMFPKYWSKNCGIFIENEGTWIYSDEYNKYNWVKKDGELLSDQWYDSFTSFSGDVAMVKLSRQYNWVKRDGSLLSPNLWFDWVDKFDNGYAAVRLDRKYNWVKKEDGELLVKNLWFDEAGTSKNGQFVALLNTEFIYVSNKGNMFDTEEKAIKDNNN